MSARPQNLPVHAVLFDLDGTIVDSEKESAEAMARALADGQGIVIEDADRDQIIGRSWVEIYRSLCERYPQLRWTREELIAATALHREEIFKEQGLEALPGAIEVLHRFSEWGLPLGLVTGSSRVEMEQAVSALQIRDRFQVILACEDVASSKPSPEGYLQAAAELGQEPGRCLVIEDSRAGIAAGLRAGMRVLAVQVGNFSGQDQSAAHLQIETLEELDLECLTRVMVGSGQSEEPR